MSRAVSPSPIAIIMGETAAGKTKLALRLAQSWNAEIISADSRQIYRGMDIGTAAPSAEELAAVPHHLIGFLDPGEPYSAARFAADAIAIIRDVFARGKRVVVCGGTGFYVRALCGDMLLGTGRDDALRARMRREEQLHEPGWLYEWLQLRDPRRAAQVHPNDRYRVVRALEQALAAGTGGKARPPDEAPVEIATLASCGWRGRKFWLRQPLEVLEARIAVRTAAMLEAGFIIEAERVGLGAVAASAVGYDQVFAYLRGCATYSELRELIARGTRRYAKRQRTWLRTEPGLTVLDASQTVETLAQLITGCCTPEVR